MVLRVVETPSTPWMNASGVYNVSGQQGISASAAAAVLVIAHTQAQMLVGLGRQIAVSF